MPARCSAPDRLPPVRTASAISRGGGAQRAVVDGLGGQPQPLEQRQPARRPWSTGSAPSARRGGRGSAGRARAAAAGRGRSAAAAPSSRSARAGEQRRARRGRAASPTTSRRGSARRPITARVSNGSCWPISSNCSTTRGTTNIISAKTTKRGDEREHDRIGERAQHLAAHLRLPLEQAGEPLEDRRQGARSLARRDHAAVERREARRLARHRLGQPPALEHRAVDRRAGRRGPAPSRSGGRSCAAPPRAG